MGFSVAQVALVLCLAGTSLAAVAIGPAVVHPDHPGKCWLPKQSRSYADGAQWQEPNCMRATCLSYKSQLYVEYATCGPVAAGPGCKPVQDLSLPYPSCCPIISCPNADPDALKGEEYDEFTNWISEYYDNPTPTA
uniref:Single VWC domain protein 4 n=1 Tax=Penaeus vannamei TaxID=6689 RepID=F5AW45_PENVA|nr:uncharacterized protein LOC113816013 [Penaeus vannamei]AEB54794.1 single VWC domain protein 4 [Penaeus vannamei]WKV34895.1 Vago transcript isoform 4 [Penaeus monodon]